MAIAPMTTPAKNLVDKNLVTTDKLLELSAQDHRYELVKGKLIEMSPAGTRHGRIAGNALFYLLSFAKENKLGVVYAAETGFKLTENPDTVRAADAAFIAQERFPPEGEPEGYWAIAPDLVVEVVSPSDSAQMVQAKVTDWLTAGCRLVWVVYPDTQTVTEYHSLSEARVLTHQQKLEGGAVLPGFECLIEQLFS
jgi:Uma2 family endonuclease